MSPLAAFPDIIKKTESDSNPGHPGGNMCPISAPMPQQLWSDTRINAACHTRNCKQLEWIRLTSQGDNFQNKIFWHYYYYYSGTINGNVRKLSLSVIIKTTWPLFFVLLGLFRIYFMVVLRFRHNTLDQKYKPMNPMGYTKSLEFLNFIYISQNWIWVTLWNHFFFFFTFNRTSNVTFYLMTLKNSSRNTNDKI